MVAEQPNARGRKIRTKNLFMTKFRPFGPMVQDPEGPRLKRPDSEVQNGTTV